MIIILEDNLNRITALGPYLTNQFKVFDNAADCIAFLKDDPPKIDLFMLDHDLGGEPPYYFGPDNDPKGLNTGSEVARHMAKFPFAAEIPVFLHSMNPPGTQSMSNILKDAGYQEVHVLPFTRLLDMLKTGKIKL